MDGWENMSSVFLIKLLPASKVESDSILILDKPNENKMKDEHVSKFWKFQYCVFL